MSGAVLVAAVEAMLPEWLAAYARHRDAPGVAAGRRRWAAVMTAALVGSSVEDPLFVRHAVVVAVARAVARAVGGRVDAAELEGALDWPGEVAPGLLARLEAVIAGLDWAVEEDVLGPLYGALISAEQRKGAGEHYTPDWLARRVLARTMSAGDSVMDPSCGSGTFVFHAVRRALAEPGVEIAEVVRRVRGVDVHPVAVVLARVNYLLALGRERARGVEAPIRCGDAMTMTGEPVRLLVGNPPWLAYRFMAAEVQAAFRTRSDEYGLWGGGTVSTHQDLCGLFVVRVIDEYLREGGRFGFVMPGAVLDRAQFVGLRGGRFGGVCVDYVEGWDMRRVRPHVFPVGAAVVVGRRAAQVGRALRATEVWGRDAASSGTVGVTTEGERSPYHARFRQGATLVPRVLTLVERAAGGVRSVRSACEKPPWRELVGLCGAVEAEFLWSVVLGEHVVPYRSLASALAVVPWGAQGWVEASMQAPGLAAWWRDAEARWLAHRVSGRLTLRGQLDYQQKLARQVPVAPLRVVYTKSGMHLAAAKVRDGRAIIDHTLYWAAVGCEAEADYLCALLNAGEVTRRVRPWMAYGKDERHIDKNVWRLAIPSFNGEDAVHRALADAGRRAEAEIAARAVAGRCVAVRREIRGVLADSAVGREIEGLVGELLGPG